VMIVPRVLQLLESNLAEPGCSGPYTYFSAC
jgi:hypothetical protein